MAMRLGRGLLVIAALVVVACGGPGFKSTTYGYSLTLPSGWTTIQATEAWDGTKAYNHESPESDQFNGSAAASAWAVAAPTDKDLAGYTTELIAGRPSGVRNRQLPFQLAAFGSRRLCVGFALTRRLPQPKPGRRPLAD